MKSRKRTASRGSSSAADQTARELGPNTERPIAWSYLVQNGPPCTPPVLGAVLPQRPPDIGPVQYPGVQVVAIYPADTLPDVGARAGVLALVERWGRLCFKFNEKTEGGRWAKAVIKDCISDLVRALGRKG